MSLFEEFFVFVSPTAERRGAFAARDAAEAMLERNGATIAKSYSKKVTHVVSSSNDSDAAALAALAPVELEFFTDSIALNSLQDESKYKVSPVSQAKATKRARGADEPEKFGILPTTQSAAKKQKVGFFANFSFDDFWDNSRQDYLNPPFTPKIITEVEKKLKYTLPASYVHLMGIRNGGVPKSQLRFHRTKKPTSWSSTGVAIEGIFGIALTGNHSIGNSKFWEDEWEYPNIGIYFADCPSGGHDMLAMDYRKCGPKGEPAIVHVDQEEDYKITPVAQNFEEFIRGLEDHVDDDDGDGDGDDGEDDDEEED